MREILFRGKRLNGEWVEGLPSYGARNISRIESFIANTYIKEYEIDSSTVCQYTGLTDKNGKKIFEGDIINDIDYGIMRCLYLHGSFVWYKEDGFYIKCMNYIPVIEVIGNIFDNPDLLTTSSTDSD